MNSTDLKNNWSKWSRSLQTLSSASSDRHQSVITHSHPVLCFKYLFFYAFFVYLRKGNIFLFLVYIPHAANVQIYVSRSWSRSHTANYIFVVVVGLLYSLAALRFHQVVLWCVRFSWATLKTHSSFPFVSFRRQINNRNRNLSKSKRNTKKNYMW